MMIPARPQFHDAAAARAFNVSTLAALRGANTARRPNRGLGSSLPNYESHPEVLDQARMELAAHGIDTTCHEEVQTSPGSWGAGGTGTTYYRYCETANGAQIAADLFRSDLPDWYRDRMAQVAAEDVARQSWSPDQWAASVSGQPIPLDFSSTPGYSPSPMQLHQQRQAAQLQQQIQTHQTASQQGASGGGVADRQPGTVRSGQDVQRVEDTKTDNGVLGMNSRTLLIGFAAVAALLMVSGLERK